MGRFEQPSFIIFVTLEKLLLAAIGGDILDEDDISTLSNEMAVLDKSSSKLNLFALLIFFSIYNVCAIMKQL